MSELATLRRLHAQLQQQNASLAACNEQLTRDNERFLNDNKRFARDNERFLNDAKSAAAQVSDLQQDNTDLRTQLQQSRDELAALIRRIFGRQSERYLGDAAGQLLLAFDSEDAIEDARAGILQALEEHREQAEAKKKKRRKRRGTSELFPDHLPRQEIIVDLDDDEKEGLQRIGEDITETLHFRRPVLHVVRKIFPKYVRPAKPDAGVRQAPRPSSLVAGDRYDTSIAAQLITGKYGYHLPVYRQEDMFAGSGVHLPRSTLLNVLSASAELIRPFIDYLSDVVRTDPCLGTDDTGVCLLLPEFIPAIDSDDPKSKRVHEVISKAIATKKKSLTAKMWVYRGMSIPLNIFDFTVSRHRDGYPLRPVPPGPVSD